MGTSLATYYAKLLDMPDSEYKVEMAVSYTHLTLPTTSRV